MSESVARPDPASFDELVARHRGGVFRICRSILRDEHLGADAAQEAFVRLWHRLRTKSRPDSFTAWLRSAAVSASLDLARRRRVRDDAQELARRDASSMDRDDPERSARESELARQLERALAKLPEGQRTVFLLRHEGGLGLSEAAAALGVEPSTVKTQFARACLRLQTLLAPYAPDRDETS